ncbi:hypothetical protein K2173_000346 [Erythroxylum novogranatense]|uniref:GIR1-like zinc ribbon domain-containing protein n=1 Tax=Erythroxylum novogranatense TaxID=1862640 RepID=A0AAV8SX84_9ROSI|nr:hypothetical protein K2173_000346 [Erythroxylum novogranatense]
MAADVSSMVNSGNSEMLVTKDLLGELSKVAVHNDLQAIPLPDLKLKSSNPPMHSSSSLTSMVETKKHNTYDHHVMRRTSQLQNRDLSYNNNFSALRFLEETSLELKLQGPATYGPTHSQSVCTLDKVKSALQRAEKQSYLKKRPSSSPPTDHNQEDEQEQGSETDGKGTMFAAGCPGCCMYVMTLKNNPKCPRCSATIPSPLLLAKRPRLDLNATV